MKSDYYSDSDLINVLKSHLLPEDVKNADFNSIIADGEIYPHAINGVTGCYIYGIKGLSFNEFTVFVHPTICIEVFFDPFQTKEMYMTGNLVL